MDIEKQIVKLILDYKPVEKIVLFGSRSNGTQKNNSDYDIAIFGKSWTDRDTNIMKDRLEESIITPLKFDVVNYHMVKNESLKTKIMETGVTIYG